MTPTRKLGLGGFLLAGAVAGGISLASLNTANAASATTPTAVAATDDGSTASTDTSATATDPAPAGPHTANGITETVRLRVLTDVTQAGGRFVRLRVSRQ